MKRRILFAALVASAMAVPALAAEPIEGLWKRPSTGTLIKYSKCGSSFCGVVQSGSYAGQSIGKMKGSGNNYSGTVTDLEENKTYKGKATISGNTMKLSGCVLGGLICRGENWKRQ